MKKLIGIFLLTFIWPALTWAQNPPCSGKKGGISHCQGSQFICNDGSTSRSRKNCSSGSSEADTASAPEATVADKPRTETLEKTSITQQGDLLELGYQGFTLWLDCRQRAPVKFRYNAQHDSGNEARTKDFKLDPNVPKECQQTSTAAYGHGYDRGHQLCNL